MQAQEDPTPWLIDELNSVAAQQVTDITEPILHGRAFFSQLGIVRRKPCPFIFLRDTSSSPTYDA